MYIRNIYLEINTFSQIYYSLSKAPVKLLDCFHKNIKHYKFLTLIITRNVSYKINKSLKIN